MGLNCSGKQAHLSWNKWFTTNLEDLFVFGQNIEQIARKIGVSWFAFCQGSLHNKIKKKNVSNKPHRKSSRQARLTFWSAFSFSSKLWVEVSRLVWVWVNSFSSCCIFFSRASTSSLAWTKSRQRIFQARMGMIKIKFDGENRRRKKARINNGFEGDLRLEEPFLSPRVLC